MKKKLKIFGSAVLAMSLILGIAACSGETTEKANEDSANSNSSGTSGTNGKSDSGDDSGSVEVKESLSFIPTYNDNYVAAGLVSFSQRSKWNLANTHDPTVFKWTDGYYYMFGTDASYGNEHEKATTGKHFQGKRSKDLVNWEYVPGIMDDIPDWLVTRLNEFRTAQGLDPIAKADISAGYWAPTARVITVNGVKKVRMYYDIVVDNYIGNGKANTAANYDGTWVERAFIGVAESTNPNGGPSAWTDLGYVLCSSSDKGKDGYARSSANSWNDAYFYFNAIDPSYFIDEDDTHWMVYGSWHSGFALVRINPATGKVAKVDGSDYLNGKVTGDFEMGEPWAGSAEGLKENGFGTRIFARGTSRWQPSEGPELVKKDGYYWLFFANDGLDIPYQTRVVRASKIEGPYYAIQGSEMTNDIDNKRNSSLTILPIVTHPYKFNDADNGLGSCYGWVGISHCAIFQDDDDNWYYMSQQRLPTNVAGNPYSNAVMMGGVRRLVWTPKEVGSDELWPMVLPERYGALPEEYSGDVSESDLPGTWQHINLVYDYGNMDVAEELKINADGTMTGALEGTWEFSESDQQITFTPASGTAFVVTVAREVNWESNPRAPTIVYTGTVNNGAESYTYWGKKDSDSVEVTYAESYAAATLQSTYTMTLTDAAKDDLAWYLYPQFGTWKYVVDEGSGESEPATLSAAEAWWKGSDENKSTKHTLSDGGKLTIYASTSATNGTMVIEGFSESANTYATLNIHGSADTDSWGDAVSSWTRSVTGITAGALSLKIEISRSGATQTVKVYKK